MVLTENEVSEIKKKLFEHVSGFPEDKRIQVEAQINNMDAVQLEEFVKANNLVKEDDGGESCPFCSIVSGKIPSTKIGENSSAIAVLEISPISRGHVLIIPKEHVNSPDKLPSDLQELVKEISEKLKSKFSPKDILVKSVNLFGHEIVNLLPVYTNETMDSPKTQVAPEELSKLKNELDSVKIVEEIKTEKIEKDSKVEEISEDDMILPSRIP